MNNFNDKFNEECAVVGVIGDSEASNFCYLGLYAMQHRGQEGAGIVSSDDSSITLIFPAGLKQAIRFPCTSTETWSENLDILFFTTFWILVSKPEGEGVINNLFKKS